MFVYYSPFKLNKFEYNIDKKLVGVLM